MEQLNKVELRGAVGNVKTQNFSGNVMTRFTLATNYAYKDKEGAAVIDTSWHNVVAWQNKNMPDLSALDKGSKVYVLGRLRYQKYVNSEGLEKSITEIIASRVSILDDQTNLQNED